MSSWKCLELLLSVGNIANFVLITPVYWDKQNQKYDGVEANPSSFRRLFQVPAECAILVWNFVTIVYLGYCGHPAEDQDVAESIPAIFLSFLFLLSMSVVVNHLRFGTSYPEMFNTYIYLIKNNPTSCHENRKMETIIQILHAAAALSIVFGFPGALVCLEYNITGFRTFKSQYIWVNILQTGCVVSLGGVDWLIVVPTVDMILIHISTTAALQDYMIREWSNPLGLDLNKRWELHKMYRMQQVHHAMAMYSAGSLLPYIIPIAEGIVTVGIFGVIRYGTELHPFVTLTGVAVALFATITLALALQLAQTTIDNSKTYKELYKHSSEVQKNVDWYRFHSYRPLHWVIGGTFRIERDTFPKIMQNVVIDTVVNLLVFSNAK